MGKASRRKGAARKETLTPEQTPAPFVGRPFAGLSDETDWVALREIVPAATAELRLRPGALAEYGVEGEVPETVTLATVLPLAWPGLRRGDGTWLIAAQVQGSSGDASRDLAAALLAVASSTPGEPVNHLGRVTAATPRLQDLLDVDAPLEVTLHEGFEFWLAPGVELDDAGKASLENANGAAVPTVAVEDVPSAYWVKIGARFYIRLVLPYDEDAATTALARLKAAGTHRIGEGTTLLGAFRASGLLVPVWEVDGDADPASYAPGLRDVLAGIESALDSTEPLTDDERRARDGLVSRQVTLR